MNVNHYFDNLCQYEGLLKKLARYLLMAAEEVTRVVHRCEQANEDGKLDLSHCRLTSFPDAVFHLMRHTVLMTCDLSHNVLKKLPAKFASTFIHVKVLDVSSNRLERLPDELSQLLDLQTLNASNNCLVTFPATLVSTLPQLKTLNLQNNNITDVDCQCLIAAVCNLHEVNLEENPLTIECQTQLKSILNLNIKMSDPADNVHLD